MDINWPEDSVIYQIYPRSFLDTNGDGIGDLQGIINKIDYLKHLGITAVWLSPIYKSPQKDFGYDVSDYRRIDKSYGSIKKFEELVAKLHKKNIKIMMDYIPNHTSNHHPWFEKSKKDKKNSKRNWYIWKDPKPDGSPPTNWLSVFGGSAWQFDKHTKQYYLHTFDVNQPDLNWHNPEVVHHMLGILNYWIRKGVDGFRIDAIYHLFKNNTFKDEPANPNFSADTKNPYESLLHTETYGLDQTIEVMKKITSVLKTSTGKFSVGEVHTDINGLEKIYKKVGWRYFQPFNFSLIQLPWTAKSHKLYVDKYDTAIGKHYYPCYVSGNHDVKRVASRLGEKQARNLAIMLLTLRGTSFIYSGDEIGMQDTEIKENEIKDTYELRSPGLGLGRDPQRTPMQWNITKNAGFTKGHPWLPLNKNYKKINVELQKEDNKSLLSLYRNLIKLKEKNLILKEGLYEPLPMPAPNVYAYVRQLQDEKILVLINFDNKPKRISMNHKQVKIIIDSFLKREKYQKVDLQNFNLKPDEGIIFEL